MSSEQWHADIHVTEELVKNCLQEQFPSLSPIKTIKCIGEGWDNKVFLANEKIIFRFPRRKVAVELIERENAVLKNLQSLLNIAIPNPKYIGHPTSHYPYPFHGYDMIQGKSACHAHLSSQEHIASLAPLAIFLKQLHSIHEVQALALGAMPQVFDRVDVDRVVGGLNERVDKIIARKICAINKDCFQHEMVVAQNIKLPDDKCLVHGDLDSRHLLFDHGQLNGIIDWGDLGINNKAVDVAVIWSFYPAACHEQFFAIYGAIDSATWQYARFLGLHSALTIMLYAHDMGDSLLVTEAMSTVKKINADMVFGGR